MTTDIIESKVENGYSHEGLTFNRLYTQEGINPLDQVRYNSRETKIVNRKTGEVLFHLDKIEAPESWIAACSGYCG